MCLSNSRAVCQLCICVGDAAASRMAGQQHLPMRRSNHDGMSKCTTKLKSLGMPTAWVRRRRASTTYLRPLVEPRGHSACLVWSCLSARALVSHVLDSGLLSRQQGPGTTSCVVTLVLIMAPSLSFFFSTCPRLIDHGMSPFWVLLAAVQLVPPNLTPVFRQSTSHACCLAAIMSLSMPLCEVDYMLQ